MSGDWFGDIGGDISSFASDVGSGISDAASSVANAIGTGANYVSNAIGSGISGLTSLFSGSNTTPGATTNTGSTSGVPGGVSPNQVLSSLGAQPGSAQSAVSGSAFPNGVDPSNPNAGTDVTPTQNSSAPQTPSTLQQISSALGLGNVSTGDLLKGALGAGGLGYAVANNMGGNPYQKQLEANAQSQNAQGQQLESYLASGTLPPGAQQWVNQQTAAQTAAIKSKYANLGLSGSTAETQELNNVQEQATSQMFQIASELYNTGVTQTGASGQLYQLLMQDQNTSNQQMGSAISNFVAALGGGTGTQPKGTISFGG